MGSATLLSTLTPECCPRDQGPDATDGKEAARCEEPRHHLGTGPWVFGVLAWKIEQVDRSPENAEQHGAGGGEGHISKDGEDAFASHSDTMPSAGDGVMLRLYAFGNVRFPPEPDVNGAIGCA